MRDLYEVRLFSLFSKINSKNSRFADNLVNKTCTIAVHKANQGASTDFLSSEIFVGGGAFIKTDRALPTKKSFFGLEGFSSQEGFDMVIFWENKYTEGCRSYDSVLVTCEESVEEADEVYLMETINDHRGQSSTINFQVYGVKPDTFLQVYI